MKAWIKINLSKITLALAGLSFILATTGLVLGSQAYNQTNNYKSFLNYDYTVTWGGATIWSHKSGDYHKIDLYFGIKSKHQGDTRWNGLYPDGYFINY